MKTRLIEVTNYPHGGNYGKFMLATFDRDEFDFASVIDPGKGLLARCAITPMHVLVFDLQTKEGALFIPGDSNANADLERHKVWVCPLFQPFLDWLYKQPDPMAVESPVYFTFPDTYLVGYRRQG